MIDLNRPETYGELDRGEMLSHLRALPESCRKAWQQAEAFRLPADYSGTKRIVVLGMGGSAIGGDLVRGLASVGGSSVLVHRDYAPVPFVDGETLVVASSYSGMTEETLSAFAAVLPTACRKLAVTRGGRLAEMARQAGVPVFPVDYVSPPRAAIAYSFFPLLSFAGRLGLVRVTADDVEDTVRLLEALRNRLDVGAQANVNLAKRLAGTLKDTVPVVYGAGFLASVAQRWKTQINENAKAAAFYEALPELNHNAVVGYEYPGDAGRRLSYVILSSVLLSERIRLRQRVTSELLRRSGKALHVVEGEGDSELSQLMSLLYVGDWASYYLALLYGVDPTPVAVIEYLKNRLSQAGQVSP